MKRYVLFVLALLVVVGFAAFIHAAGNRGLAGDQGVPALPPVPPTLDIKCNGEDTNVIVPSTDPVVLTIHIDPGTMFWYPWDIWVVCKNLDTGEVKSYGHYDPCNPDSPEWEKGLCNFFWRGAIGSCIIDLTILNHTLPVGNYKAWVFLDTSCNGDVNIPDIYDYDRVDFQVVL